MDCVNENCNSFQKEKFLEFFKYIDKNYYGNEDRNLMISKFELHTRTTNLIEANHNVINKSFVGKNKNKENAVQCK